MNDEKRPTGMSTGMKVLIGVLIGCGVIMLLCCGGGIYLFKKTVQMTQNPAEVKEITQSFIKIDIPADYEPKMGMSMNIGFAMKMGLYQRGTTGILMLMNMAFPAPVPEDQMKQSFDQQMQQQGQNRALKDKMSETRTFKIDGEDRQFEFATGVDPRTNQQVHQVTGMFPSGNGFVMLMLTEDKEHWNEEQVTKMIGSISTK